jgi:hypothetical protein
MQMSLKIKRADAMPKNNYSPCYTWTRRAHRTHKDKKLLHTGRVKRGHFVRMGIFMRADVTIH